MKLAEQLYLLTGKTSSLTIRPLRKPQDDTGDYINLSCGDISEESVAHG